MSRIKKIISLIIFSVILVFDLFAAVVSDNDGAAFITKAEFDSLKNNFQSQLDQYNQSIDSKIDNAIASYLSGIKISKTESLQVLLNNIYDRNTADASFCDLSNISVSTNNYFGVEGCVSWIYATDRDPACFFANQSEWGPWFALTTGDYDHQNGGVTNYKPMIYTKERIVEHRNNLYFYPIDEWTEAGKHSMSEFGIAAYWAGGSTRTGYFPSSYTSDLTEFKQPFAKKMVFTGFNYDCTGVKHHEYKYSNDTRYVGILYNASSSIKSNDLYTINYNNKLLFDDIWKDSYPDPHQVIYNTSSTDQAVTNNIQHYHGLNDYAGSSGPSTKGGTALKRKGDIYFYFKYYRQKRYKHNQTEWINYNSFVEINKPVTKYNGVPLIEIEKSGKLKFKLNFTGFTVSASGSAKPTTFDFAISSIPFSNIEIYNEPFYNVDYGDGYGKRKDGVVFYAENIEISNVLTVNGDIDLSEMEFADNKSKIFYIKVKPNQEGINVYSPTSTWEYTLNAE